MHQSILRVNISCHATPRVLHLFSAKVPAQGFVPSELPGDCREVEPIIEVPSCQLMPHEGTFQLQTDLLSIADV